MFALQARRQAHVPTIMSSETGVGKTKLLHVYSQIINSGNQHHLKLHNALKQAVQAHAASLPQDAGQHALMLKQTFASLADVSESSIDMAAMLQAMLYLAAHLAGYTSMPVPGRGLVWQAQPEPIVTDPQTLGILLTQLRTIITENLVNQPVLQVGQFVFIQSELISKATVTQASSGRRIADAAQEAAVQWHLLPRHVQGTQTALGSNDDFRQGKGALTPAFDLIADQVVADFDSFAVMLAAVAAAMATEMHPVLTVLPMHAKVDQHQLSASLQPVVNLAEACPEYTFTFFVDELNTSTIIGDLKDIFTDHRFKGQRLPSNIFLVAAINPYRPKAVQATADGSQASDDSYNVRALPDSMLELVWDFGSLSAEQEKAYIAAKLRMSAAHSLSDARLGKFQDRKLASFVTQAQVSNARLQVCRVFWCNYNKTGLLVRLQQNWLGATTTKLACCPLSPCALTT